MNQSVSQNLLQVAKKNPRIVILNGDSLEESGLDNFAKHFPKQFYQFGAGSCSMISAAAGLSLRNKIPVIVGNANEILKAYSEIRSLIAYPNLNVKFLLLNSGICGEKISPATNGFEDLGVLRSLPNVKIVAPADKMEAKSAIEEMINEIGPCFLRLCQNDQEIFKYPVEFSFGNNQAIKDGEEICIFSYGKMLKTAMSVAKTLEEKLKSVAVVNLSSIMPVDIDLILNYAEKVKFCVVLEDHSVLGGLGTIVAEVLATNFPKQLLMIGIEDQRIKFGSPKDLKKLYGIDHDSVVEKILELC